MILAGEAKRTKVVSAVVGLLALVRRCTRYSITSMAWMSVLVAVLLLWYRDHQKLTQELTVGFGKDFPEWSIDQIVGTPNTSRPGDAVTAWASEFADAEDEFVIVEFPQAVIAAALEVHETYNPGAVVRLSAVHSNGSETPLWSGTDPLDGTSGGGVSRITFSAPMRTRRLKIELDSETHRNWNEIDAVCLIDDKGERFREQLRSS